MSIKAFFKESSSYYSQTGTIVVLSSPSEEHLSQNIFVVVVDELTNKELFVLQIKCEYYSSFFRGLKIWRHFIAIGFENRVFIFNCNTQNVLRHKLNSFFDSFFESDDYLFICSASNINCFNNNGEFVWRSDKLGSEHVNITGVNEQSVCGSGKWLDKDWHDFEICLKDGRDCSLPEKAEKKGIKNLINRFKKGA